MQLSSAPASGGRPVLPSVRTDPGQAAWQQGSHPQSLLLVEQEDRPTFVLFLTVYTRLRLRKGHQPRRQRKVIAAWLSMGGLSRGVVCEDCF